MVSQAVLEAREKATQAQEESDNKRLELCRVRGWTEADAIRYVELGKVIRTRQEAKAEYIEALIIRLANNLPEEQAEAELISYYNQLQGYSEGDMNDAIEQTEILDKYGKGVK